MDVVMKRGGGDRIVAWQAGGTGVAVRWLVSRFEDGKKYKALHNAQNTSKLITSSQKMQKYIF
jgi:hypothetical protein